MKLEVTLELDINITDEPLNINGIIKSVHSQQSQLSKAVLSEIVEAIDSNAVEALRSTDDSSRYRHKGYSTRSFKTPMGTVRVRFTKLFDTLSNTMCTPGREALEVPKYKTWLPWCLTPAAGLLAKVSYEQSASEASRLQGNAPSKSTLHRRLEELVGDGSFGPDLRKRRFRYLMIDGTGARFQKRDCADKAEFYEGEIRFAYAAVGEHKPFELVGMWVNKSWSECAQELFPRMNTEYLEALICDGGPGMEEAFLLPHMSMQRCQWHGKRDFSFILYADGLKKQEQQQFLEAFNAIPMTCLHKQEVEELAQQDAEELNRLRQKSNHAFCDLYMFLQSKGYHKAATYVENLARPFVSFIDHLLQTGHLLPTTSNIIEGKIGLFKNRIKAVGRRWSEKGLLRWLAIAVRKLLPEYNWDKLWDKITGNPLPVKITLDLVVTRTVCH